MKKEILVAIVFGFVVGLIIVFGVITARTALREHQPATNADSKTSTPSPAPTQGVELHQVSVTDPVDGTVVNADTVTLRGKTSPGSNVVISTENGHHITAADSSGSFAQEIALVSGANDMTVVSFSPKEERAETAVIIVFSTAAF